MKCCEAEQLTPYNGTPCSGGPGPPRAGAGLTAFPRHARLLGEGMEGEKKRKTKEEKEKGTLGHTKTGEVCCEQAVSEGMRKDLQRERK